MEKETTALAVSGPRRLITSLPGLEQVLQTWQTEQVHSLCPIIDFGALPEQYALVPAKVKIDPRPVMADVYKGHFCKEGEVALSAIGLQKLAHCAGISLHTKRTDPRNIPHLWEFQAVASWTGLDGARVERSATLEYDLRDGSERLKGFTVNQINEARKHGARGAETRAISAVIRQLGIKQKYTVQELQRPFGLVRVVYQPNMADPVQRAIVAQNALGGAHAFAHPGAPPALGAGHVIEGELLASTDTAPAAAVVPATKPAAPETKPAPAETKRPAAETATEDFDPVPGAVEAPAEAAAEWRRLSVVTVQKEKVGDFYRFYVLASETGDLRLQTEDEALARVALKCKGQGAVVDVRLQVEENPDTKAEETWIVGLRLADAAATSPLPTSNSQPPAAAAAPALPEGACFVESIDEKSGVKQRPGKADLAWTKFTVTFSTGEVGVSFSTTIAATATEAKEKRLPVRVTLETNPAYPDQQNVTALTIVDTRQASFLESEL